MLSPVLGQPRHKVLYAILRMESPLIRIVEGPFHQEMR